MDSLDVQLHSLHLRAQLDKLDASFEANLNGNLDSIFAKDMQLIFRNEKLFSGNVALYHPMELDSMYVNANCTDLYCNNALLQDILSQLQMKPIQLPLIVNRLGHVHYKGDIRGRVEKIDLHGAFTTALGAVKVNGDVRGDATLLNFDFCGHVSTRRFNLGRLLGQKDLGTIEFHAHVDGEIDTTGLMHCVADADIEKIEYKGYCYQHIRVDGEILLNGENILSMEPIDVRRRVGMVFQRPAPFPTMSIYDNVLSGFALNGIKLSKAEKDAAVERCLRSVALWDEVKDVLNKKGTFLSGGQQQRLCIARALAMKPDVLLMDEPTSALDPIATKHIEELLLELQQEVTILIVTHNMGQAKRISSKSMFMYLGELVEYGETETMFTNPVDERTKAYLTGKMG